LKTKELCKSEALSKATGKAGSKQRSQRARKRVSHKLRANFLIVILKIKDLENVDPENKGLS